MTERRLRYAIVGLMVVTLFLPTNPRRDPEPNWAMILSSSVQAIRVLLSPTSVGNRASWLGILAFWWAVPVLCMLSLCLARRPSGSLRALYGILILILLPLTWYVALEAQADWRGVGFWGHVGAVSLASAAEILTLVMERYRKRQGALSGRP